MLDKAAVALALVLGVAAALYAYSRTLSAYNPLDAWVKAESLRGDCYLYVYPNGTARWAGSCPARLCAYTYRISPNGTLVRVGRC